MAKTKAATSKKRNAQDLTLRNLRAAKKRYTVLERRVQALERRALAKIAKQVAVQRSSAVAALAAAPSKKLYSLADLTRDLKKRKLAFSRTPPANWTGERLTGAAASRAGATRDQTLPGGYIGTGVNEWWIVSTVGGPGDPCKIRRGQAHPTHTIYGCDSGDRIVDGVHREKTLVIYREDEDFLGQDGGAIDIFLQRPGTTDDRNMIRVKTITTRYERLYVPLILSDGTIAGGGGGVGLPTTIALRARSNGRLVAFEPSGLVVANRTALGPWEMADVIAI